MKARQDHGRHVHACSTSRATCVVSRKRTDPRGVHRSESAGAPGSEDPRERASPPRAPASLRAPPLRRLLLSGGVAVLGVGVHRRDVRQDAQKRLHLLVRLARALGAQRVRRARRRRRRRAAPGCLVRLDDARAVPAQRRGVRGGQEARLRLHEHLAQTQARLGHLCALRAKALHGQQRLEVTLKKREHRALRARRRGARRAAQRLQRRHRPRLPRRVLHVVWVLSAQSERVIRGGERARDVLVPRALVRDAVGGAAQSLRHEAVDLGRERHRRRRVRSVSYRSERLQRGARGVGDGGPATRRDARAAQRAAPRERREKHLGGDALRAFLAGERRQRDQRDAQQRVHHLHAPPDLGEGRRRRRRRQRGASADAAFAVAGAADGGQRGFGAAEERGVRAAAHVLGHQVCVRPARRAPHQLLDQPRRDRARARGGLVQTNGDQT